MGGELEISHHERRRTVVVMVVFPLQGHINPMLQLATILHSKGLGSLSIIIVHPKDLNPLNPSTHPEFTYLPLYAEGGGGHQLSAAPTVVDTVGGVMGLTVALNKAYKVSFEKSIQELIKGKKIKIRCIIYDAFMYFAQSVADQLNIPGINLRTSSAATILGIAAASQSPDELGFNTPVQVPMEFWMQVPELQALELDNIVKRLKATVTKESLGGIAGITTAFNKSTAILVNTMDFLEWAAIKKAQEYLSAIIYPIGPFHKYADNPSNSYSLFKEDTYCVAWLDQHPPRSVIYVSFGSLASITEEDLLETATGVTQSGQPFLWVVRSGLVHGGRDWAEILPPNLIKRVKAQGCVVGWAAQRRVLSHGSVGGFWTHCGWNSTMESVCQGVPMICSPFFGDQFWNANYISKVWKIGLVLEDKLERGNIERTVTKLMVGKKGEEMRKRALDMKDKADLCFSEGGSSHNYVNQLLDFIFSY